MFSVLKRILTSKYFYASIFGLHTFYANKFHCRKLKPVAKCKPLSKSEANSRAEHISDVHYKLFLNLTQTKDIFTGEVEILFSLTNTTNFFIDFHGILEKIVINKSEIKNFKFEDNRIYIEEKDLHNGRNNIKIYFKSHYGTDKGLCLNNEIIQTYLEPFKAHYMFPCFDQPQISFLFDLSILSKNDLNIVSNSQIENITDDKSDCHITKFKQIKSISTHQINLTAAKFKTLKDDTLTNLQINYYSSENVTINHAKLTEFISKIIASFTRNFKAKFPYEKIDIVILENYKNVSSAYPGVIIINEKFTLPSQDIIDQSYYHLSIATSIIKMWFSNKISIKWWDDAFFLESLSLFLSNLLIKENFEYTEENDEYNLAWNVFDFFKSKALISSKSSDAHQVIFDIEDTEEADILIDNELTLFKATSLLKYIYNLNTPLFMESIEKFLSTNLDLRVSHNFVSYRDYLDILGTIEGGNEEDDFSVLSQFKYHLVNEKVPRLTLKILKLDLTETFNKIAVIQEFPNIFEHVNEETTEENVYYPYTLDILLKYEDHEAIIKNVKVLPKRVSIITLDKSYDKPLCAILNPGDSAFMTQRYEEFSRNYLVEKTSELWNPDTRLMVIRDKFELVKDGDYDPMLFLKFSENLLKNEKNVYILNKLLSQTIWVIINLLPQSNNFTQKQYFFKFISEKLFRNNICETYLYKNMVNYLLDLLNIKDAENIKFLLEVNLEITIDSAINENSDINFDESRRYDLTRLDTRTKERLIEAIYESDRFAYFQKEDLKKSILDSKHSLLTEITFQTCGLHYSEEKTRQSLWNLFVYKDQSYNDNQIYAYMKGFNRFKITYNKNDGNIKEFFKKKFFKDLIYVCENYSEEYTVKFYKLLKPTHIINEKTLTKLLKLKSKIGFDDYKNTKLRYLIEEDILELRTKLLIMKSYKSLYLFNLRNRGIRI